MSRRLILTTFTLFGSVLMNHRAAADITLTSPDGRWQAVIEDEGGAVGQCNGLRDIDQVAAYEPFLANTKHYVRIGTSLSWATAVTSPMEDNFSKLSFAYSGNTFTAVLRSNTQQGVIAVVHGEMVDGAAGGLRVSLSFHDTDPSAIVLGQYNVKPFVYANMNVDGQMTNNVGSWVAPDRFTQSANNTGTGNIRWFRGRDVVGHQSEFHSFMQDALENGLQELDNTSVGGPSDINASLSFAASGLGPGNVHTIAYAIGNQNISIPSGFGLPPNAGAVSINSTDGRWSSLIRTGLGTPGLGSAGEIDNVMDFIEPAPTALFASHAAYWFSAQNTLGLWSSPLRDWFQRVTFHYPTDTTSLVSTVLNHQTWPGLICIIDAKMISGNAGGLVVCIKFADTLNRGLNVQPMVYADLDCQNNISNTGDFMADHFHQKSADDPSSPVRWFRAPSFASHFSNFPSVVQATLNSGITELPNTVMTGPANIAAAFAFHPWPLAPNEPYVNGFAIGNSGITIPSSFVFPSAWFTCPSDIAPAPAGDGLVNVSDLLGVIADWGTCSKGLPCDGDIEPTFIGNGQVNVEDLLNVIGSWGDCYPE